MGDRVVVAGASGFIGRYLIEAFRSDSLEVSTIGRAGSDASWEDPESIRRVVDGADLIVNLAGRSVNCRYGAANRAEIMESRVDTTRMLREAVAAASEPPPLWINSSTATIYRHAEDREMTESRGELGEGFSVSVARAWENEFFEGELPRTRRVALRMAIVLGDGSALTPLVRLARFGLGGPQLDGRWFSTSARRTAGTFHEFGARGGRQRFSWIHIADVLGIIRFLRDRHDLAGVINASSPNPTDNAGFMRTLRHVLRVPIGLPTPRALLEVGSFAIRTETELVLKSRWVVPETLLAAGYSFEYPELRGALESILLRGANASRT